MSENTLSFDVTRILTPRHHNTRDIAPLEKHAYMQENSDPDRDPIPDYLIFLNILKAR